MAASISHPDGTVNSYDMARDELLAAIKPYIIEILDVREM